MTAMKCMAIFMYFYYVIYGVVTFMVYSMDTHLIFDNFFTEEAYIVYIIYVLRSYL